MRSFATLLIKSAAAAVSVVALAANTVAHAASDGSRPLNITHMQSAAVSGNPALTTYGPIKFVNKSDGWVLGKRTGPTESSTETMLYRTRDGGQGWEQIPLQGDARGIGNIRFFTPLIGIGISDVTTTTKNHAFDHYAVLKTLDGGKTWTTVWRGQGPAASWSYAGSPTFFDSPDIHIMGHTAAITFSGVSLISHSEGESWTETLFPWTGYTPSDVTFSNQSDGWAIGTFPVHQDEPKANPNPKEVLVVRTSDGGLHWKTSKVISPTVGNPFADLGISFANSQDGWFYENSYGTMSGSLYRTTDGGDHWSLATSKLTVGRYMPGELSFVTPNVGWLPINSGASPLAGGIVVMTNGGTKVHTYGENKGWSINSVSLVSEQDGWATGVVPGYNNQGYVIHTTDGGKTFTQVLPSVSPTHSIAFTTDKVGYGYGLGSDPYALLKSYNYGNTWQHITDLPQRTTFLGMDFLSTQVGWVAFETEYPTGKVSERQPIHVWTTGNGGKTWSKHVEYVDYPPYSVQSISELRLYSNQSASLIVASFPKIVLVETGDGGKNWAATSISALRGETALSIVHPRTTWLLNGDNNGVTVAKVEGSTLEPVGQINDLQWPVGITFSNVNDGWFVAYRTNASENQITVDAFATNDGGGTWTEYRLSNTTPYQPLAGGEGIATMDSVGRNAVWLLTGNGLLRTMDGGKTWTWV